MRSVRIERRPSLIAAKGTLTCRRASGVLPAMNSSCFFEASTPVQIQPKHITVDTQMNKISTTMSGGEQHAMHPILCRQTETLTLSWSVKAMN